VDSIVKIVDFVLTSKIISVATVVASATTQVVIINVGSDDFGVVVEVKILEEPADEVRVSAKKTTNEHEELYTYMYHRLYCLYLTVSMYIRYGQCDK